MSDEERRKVAERLKGYVSEWRDMPNFSVQKGVACSLGIARFDVESQLLRLADLIEPSYKPDAEYETWYNNLSHFGDERGGPSTIRELIEEIVWTALTVDLGPNGNRDPSTMIDEGNVYTDKLFAEWEREALRLSGGIDRGALLALADEMDRDGKIQRTRQKDGEHWFIDGLDVKEYARRICEACGEVGE